MLAGVQSPKRVILPPLDLRALTRGVWGSPPSGIPHEPIHIVPRSFLLAKRLCVDERSAVDDEGSVPGFDSVRVDGGEAVEELSI